MVAGTFVILPDDLEGRDGHFNRALKVDPSSCLLGICEELQNARCAFYFEHNKAAGLSTRKNLIIHFNWWMVFTCHFDPLRGNGEQRRTLARCKQAAPPRALSGLQILARLAWPVNVIPAFGSSGK